VFSLGSSDRMRFSKLRLDITLFLLNVCEKFLLMICEQLEVSEF
jgi:hypothetical protein